MNKFNKVVGMSVDKLDNYLQARSRCYPQSSLSRGNQIFTFNIVLKIERFSKDSTSRLQTVERMKSLDFCTQNLKRDV